MSARISLQDTHQSNRNNLQSAMHHPFQPCRIRIILTEFVSALQDWIILTESVQPCMICNTLQDQYHLCRTHIILTESFQFCRIGLSLQDQSLITWQDSFQPYRIRINIEVSVSTLQELHHPRELIQLYIVKNVWILYALHFL